MRTPAQLIQALDRNLALAGHDIVLRRMERQTPVLFAPAADVTVRAAVRSIGRGYQSAELIGSIAQGDLNIIISPTQIIAAGWSSGRVPPDDERVPVKGNVIISGGRKYTVEGCVPIRVQNVLVRIEMQVRG